MKTLGTQVSFLNISPQTRKVHSFFFTKRLQNTLRANTYSITTRKCFFYLFVKTSNTLTEAKNGVSEFSRDCSSWNFFKKNNCSLR